MEKGTNLQVRHKSKALDIEFENVSLTVNKGFKKVVKNVSGQFKSGELTAIMGPSGAGKTTLLNILTGYQTTGVDGTIKCKNGKLSKKGVKQYIKESCYILQDDYLIEYFTVYEIMYSTTQLKLSGLSRQERDYLVDDILKTLGLLQLKKTCCGTLSGGQKKRLSIALELIDDPLLLFLDEPTTGLDSSSSTQCIQLLKCLAERGRTIICTIHQPSTMLFNMFNHVYVMADGNCVYQGAPGNIVPYLANQGYVCPKYHNPADFLLEVSSGEYGYCVDKLTIAAQEFGWRHVEKRGGAAIEQNPFRHQDSVYLYSDPNRSLHRKPSEMEKFWILAKKQMLYSCRDWTATQLKVVIHFLVGLFLGFTYQKAGIEASRSIQNCSFFMVCIVYLNFTALMTSCLRFPAEIKIIRKESFNRWYQLRTFYAAHLIVDFPLQLVFSLSFIIGSYFISSQPVELHRFLMVFLIQTLINHCAAGMGGMFGSLVDPVNGTFLGSVCTALLILFAGFLCLFNHMHPFFYFLSNFSYMSFALDGTLQAVYHFSRGKLECPVEDEFCRFTSPKELLEYLGMNRLSYWADVGWILVNVLIFRLLAFLSLRFRVKNL